MIEVEKKSLELNPTDCSETWQVIIIYAGQLYEEMSHGLCVRDFFMRVGPNLCHQILPIKNIPFGSLQTFLFIFYISCIGSGIVSTSCEVSIP